MCPSVAAPGQGSFTAHSVRFPPVAVNTRQAKHGDMLLTVLAQVALAQNPLAVTHPRAIPRPVFHADDYPFAARRHGWQGTVIADLTISARGTVDKCDVVKSSGYKLLDDSTCYILVKRANFIPREARAETRSQTFFEHPQSIGE
jgi:TonB family protein